MTIRVPLARLTEWSPFEACCWRGLGGPITRAEVAGAIAGGRFQSEPDRPKHATRCNFPKA